MLKQKSWFRPPTFTWPVGQVILIVFMLFFSSRAEAWVADEVRRHNSGDGYSLRFNLLNQPRVVYRLYNGTSYYLAYTEKTNATWTPVETFGGTPVGNPSMEIDTADNVNVVYSVHRDVRFQVRTGSTWGPFQSIDAVSASYVSLALTSTGDPRVAYYDRDAMDLKYAEWTGTSWSTRTVDSSGDVGGYASLVLDAAGNPRIAYFDRTNADLKYAEWTGTSWATQTVNAAGNVGINCSLALDSAGDPWVAYQGYFSNEVVVAHRIGAAWTSHIIRDEAYQPSIAMNSNGLPTVVYGFYSQPSFVYAAEFREGVWTHKRVLEDAPSGIATGIDLTLDRTGFLHTVSGGQAFYHASQVPMVTPTGLVGTAVSTSAIRWSWADDSDFEDGFRVRRASDGANLSGDLSPDTTAWIQPSLSPNEGVRTYVEVFKEAQSFRSSDSFLHFSAANPPIGTAVTSVWSSSAAIHWEANGNPSGTTYLAERSTDSVTFTQFFSGTGSMATATGLLADAPAYFRVRARNGNSVLTGYDSTVSTVTVAGLPLAPGRPDVSARTADSLTWIWTDNSNNEDGFRVRGFSDNADLSGLLPAGTTSWTLTGLPVNSPHRVIVESVNIFGSSSSATSFHQYTSAVPPIATAVTGKTASSVALSWSANGNPDGTRYSAYWSANNVNYTLFFPAITGTSRVVTGLSADTTYYFRVHAENGNAIATGYDAVVSTRTRMSGPGAVSVSTRTNQSITWAWPDPFTNELGYRVLRASDGFPLSSDLPAGATSWVQSELTPNTSAQVVVEVFRADNSGVSPPSSVIYSLANPPSATVPTMVGASSVTLSWSENGNPSGTDYRVYRSTDGVNFASISIGRPGTSFTATSLSDETTYYFRVQARNENLIWTEFGAAVSAKTRIRAPSWVSISSRTSDSITWRWPDDAGQEAGYRVRRVSDGFDLSGDLAANTTSWMQAGLIPNTSFQAYVEVFSPTDIAVSPLSPVQYTLASPPSDTFLTMVGRSSATVSWSANGNPSGTYYDVFSSLDGVNYTQSAFYRTETSATISSLLADTTYYFRVRAQNAQFEDSAYDAPVSAMTRMAPLGPVTVSSRTSDSITWSWSDLARSETGYRVHRSSDGWDLSGDLPAGATSWTQAGLTPNATAQVYVEAFRPGDSAVSAHSAIYRSLAVPPVGSVLSGIFSSSATFSWSANGNPSGTTYLAERSTDNVVFTQFFSGTALSASATGLLTNTTYYFQVRARNADLLTTGYDAVVSGLTGTGGVPLTPGTPALSAATADSLTWTWVDNSNNEQGFRVREWPADRDVSGDLPAGTVSWTMTGLLPNTNRRVRVEVFNTFGTVSSPIGNSSYTLARPPVGTAVTGVAGNNVTLSWSDNGNPSGTTYLVEKSTDNIAFSPGTTVSDLTCTIANLASDATHFFRVRARNWDSIPTAYDSTVSTMTGMGGPASVSVWDRSNNSITWRWPDASSGQQGYRVRQAEDGLNLSGDLASNATFWIQTGLAPNTSAQVYVEAFRTDDSGFSPVSPVVYSLASPPTGSLLSAVSSSSATLSWSSNGNPADTLYLAEKSLNGVSFTLFYSGTALSAVADGLTGETLHYFRVRARNKALATTTYDAVVSSRTRIRPPDLVLSSTRTTTSITWTWSDSSSVETGYRVRRWAEGPDLSGPLPAGTTFWTMSGLTPNASRSVVVEVFNDSESAQSPTGYGSTLPNPAVDLRLTRVKGHTATITWSPNGNPSGTYYDCFASTSSQFLPPFYQTYSFSTSTVFSGLRAETTYYFRVAVGGERDYSNVVSTVTAKTGPSSVFASQVTTGSIRWNWSDGFNDEQGYRVRRAPDGLLLSEDLAPNITSWTQTGLAPNTAQQVYVEVLRDNGAGPSPDSSVIYTLANPPADTTVTQVTSNSVTIAWSLNGNPEGTRFDAFSSLDNVVFSRFLFNQSVLSVTQTGLKEGATYYFRVRAQNGSDYGETVRAVTTLSVTIGFSTSLFSGEEDATLRMAGSAGDVQVQLLKGSFPGAVMVAMAQGSGFPAPVSPAHRLIPTGVGVSVSLDQPWQPSRKVTLSVPYPEAAVSGMDARRLVLARYDEESGSWVILPSSVDTEARRVTGVTDHFSLFQIMALVPSSSVSEVKAYPNPLRPGRPGHDWVTFSDMPVDAALKVYTLQGELVRELTSDAAGNAVWDAGNDAGEPVASGVYLVRIVGTGGDKILKVAVQR